MAQPSHSQKSTQSKSRKRISPKEQQRMQNLSALNLRLLFQKLHLSSTHSTHPPVPTNRVLAFNTF
jgi:hypothetical protein